MKKYINFAFAYAIAAMACGVFYREFTKLNGYEGITTLGKAHGHLLLLGTVVFLIIALFVHLTKLSEEKTFTVSMWFYNIGLQLTTLMLLVRGTLQVLQVPLSNGGSAAISGMAGIGHMLLGTGIILLFVALKRTATCLKPAR